MPYAYDKFGRLTGTSIGKLLPVTYKYGAGGGITATDAAGVSETILTDYNGKIAAVRDNSGSEQRFHYDGNGLSTRVETAAGHGTRFHFVLDLPLAGEQQFG